MTMAAEQPDTQMSKDGNGGSAELEVAYLGPPGTYGHQAAMDFAERLSSPSKLMPCSTITDVYYAKASYLVMPLQNTIHGGVLETLDCLLYPQSPGAGPSKRKLSDLQDSASGSLVTNGSSSTEPLIIDELDLPIRHCLVVKRGVKMEDIKWVRSHEQALGQSSAFLKEYLPDATLQPYASTAGAALSLMDSQGEGDGAAICSKSVLALHPEELDILYEGTQAHNDNYTRFILLSRGPRRSGKEVNGTSTSIATTSKSTETVFLALSDFSALSQIISDTSVTVENIHSRPFPSVIRPSDHRYPSRLLVELRGESTSSQSRIGSDLPGVIYLGSIFNNKLKAESER